MCKVAADSSELCLGWLRSADGRIGDSFKETEAEIQWLSCPDENRLSYILEQKWGACRRKGIEMFWVQENKDHHEEIFSSHSALKNG